MRLSFRPGIIAVAALLISNIFLSSAATVRAQGQDIVGGAGRSDLSGGAGGSNSSRSSGGSGGGTRKPKTKYAVTTRTVTVTKTVIKAPNTGSIVVTAPRGAAIVVEPVRGGTGDDAEIPSDSDFAVFNNIRPGRYRVAAALEGYEEAAAETDVRAGEPAPVKLELRPTTTMVTINTNVSTGEIRYAPVVATGRYDPTTNLMQYEKAPGAQTVVIPIQNGRAILSNLRPGIYGVDIRADEPGYDTLLSTVTLPGQTVYNVELKNVRSTAMFSANWSSFGDWEAPGGWRAGSGKLLVSGPGIALPRDSKYRFYGDFQLTSDVNMVNGVAASFILRAKDSNNYYLVQLTGPNAPERYVLRGFIVRNGVLSPLGAPIPIEGFADTLRANQFFRVTIKTTERNKFKVSITDSQTGDVLPLGILTDPNNNFPIGAVGLAVRDAEQNEIGSFIVCASDCR